MGHTYVQLERCFLSGVLRGCGNSSQPRLGSLEVIMLARLVGE